MGLFDAAGGEDYERLRPLSYPQTDVFTLLFDVSDSEERFKEIHSYWWAELNNHCPDAPIVLVASKIDLRTEATFKCGECDIAQFSVLRTIPHNSPFSA